MSTKKKGSAPKQRENTTDATRGEPLAARAQQRRAELATALGKIPEDQTRARRDIEQALAAVDVLLAGDPDHLTDASAADLSRWLELHKHLAEKPQGTRPAASR